MSIKVINNTVNGSIRNPNGKSIKIVTPVQIEEQLTLLQKLLNIFK